jgi:tRNA G18 (ribose-2'-O)-methylase SpoU
MDHIKEGIFVAEGEKVVRRLLASRLETLSLLLTEEWFEKLRSSEDLSRGNPAIYIAQKNIVEEIVGYNLHQGIMAVGRVPENRTTDETIGTLQKPFMLVALDGLMNSENVGVVVRNCAAFGVDAIIAGENSSSPYLRRAVRNSMGTVFTLPVVHVDNLLETLRSLHANHHTCIIGTDIRGEHQLSGAGFPGNICIVLGSEGDGLRKEVLDVCTKRVAIPMMNGTDSLNVASASAVFLYEVAKQRTKE